MKKTLWQLLGLLVVSAMFLAACGPNATEAPATSAPAASVIDCKGAKSGDQISMLYQLSLIHI